MKRFKIEDYPIGSKVHQIDDNPSEKPREIAEHMNIYDFDYLVFNDGYIAYIVRVVQ